MSVALYIDEHVHRAMVLGLRLRHIDVLTAQEDGRTGASDAVLLDRATELGRVLFTQDDDLLAEAKRRQVEGARFAGLIYAHQLSTRSATAFEIWRSWPGRWILTIWPIWSCSFRSDVRGIRVRDLP